MGQFPGGGNGPLAAANNDDAITALKAIALALSSLVVELQGLLDPRTTSGTLQLTATTSTTIANTAIRTAPASRVFLFPANQAAATLVSGANSPFVAPADYVDGTSFKVKSAGAAAGTEIFHFIIVNLG